jgi:predicted nucleotidyltransferase component of viral defense system
MAGLTRALVVNHGFGRADNYDAALLDVAQDHLLYFLHTAGVFDDGSLVFKGGTSLRKCRLGNIGRFSTDLDFAAPLEDTVVDVCAAIDGSRVGGFEFHLHPDRGDGRHWKLEVRHAEFGTPALGASVEFARRPLALPPERLGFVELPIHKRYDFALPALPVVAEAEACAEKLARYRRQSLARDLYDLHQFAQRPIDESLVRRLWVLKVWGDVVDDRRGNKPLEPSDVLTVRRENVFEPESIGSLTRPVDIADLEGRVRRRFEFLAYLDASELKWAGCDERDRAEVMAALAAMA